VAGYNSNPIIDKTAPNETNADDEIESKNDFFIAFLKGKLVFIKKYMTFSFK
jgi:hypothetical protein